MTEYTRRNKSKIKIISSSTRWSRRWHRILSITIAAVLLISSLTGLLLSWKKNVDLLQPISRSGVDMDMSNWKPVTEIAGIAKHALDSLDIDGKQIDRMDYRPDKGIVKVLFVKGYWEVQVDCTTGEILSVQRRYSDMIEKIHDGSIISDGFKLGAMNIFGFGLLFLITTGFLLWYGPRRIRKIKSI
jgi:uncharacterized iron-regulated membrane protein